jgi:hypothetical protein
MAKSLKNIMGAGIAPLQAQMINGTALDSLVATGSTQATALLLPADVNVFTTVAASTGAILGANPSPGDEIVVANLGANALLVYPPLGGNIQGGSTNAGFSVANGKSAKFVARVGSLNFIAFLSA